MRKQGKEAHQPRVRKQMHQLGDREVHHMTERKRLEPRDRRALHLQIGQKRHLPLGLDEFSLVVTQASDV